MSDCNDTPDTSDALDLAQFGGVPMMRANASDPVTWNFGVLTPNEEVLMAAAAPGLYEAFPALTGKWDGKSTVNHHEAVRRALGRDLPAQYQRIGCCGGRAGSRALELLQCVMIASGQRAKFHEVSHAFIYAAARKEYGMLNGGEGVGGGSVPPTLAKYGVVSRDESGDKDANSPQTDTVAKRWEKTGPPAAMYELAKDNLVTAMVRARSAQELADGLASGGVGCQSDMQGFSPNRDAHGYCQPQGTWAHYQVRSGVRVTADGRRGFQYDQSWGDKVPGGPLLDGTPPNVFLVPWDTQDALCKSGIVHILFSFSLWDLDNNDLDLDWVFI